MDDTKIYITGTPGFKPAVRAKLGGTWIHGSSDTSADTIMFQLPADDEPEAFKESIGEELISEYKLQFSSDPQAYFRSDKSFSMTIWTNNESKIKVRENQRPQHDPALRVF